jgi:energy-coupling factor transporter ATP-binding protein EcfA2
MREYLPDKAFFLGKALPSRPTIRIQEYRGSGANAHVYRAHSEELGRDVACKIVPTRNLVGRDQVPPLWRSEVLKADRLRSPYVVKFLAVEDWKDQINDVDCVVLISEWVEGMALREFLRATGGNVTVAFTVHFLTCMFDFFHDMALQGVDHGDFHSGNILVADRSSYALFGERYEFRITDFGVARATSEAHLKDDFFQLATVLRDILAAVDYQSASQKDKFIFNVLNDHFLARHLVERDTTHDPLARNPANLLGRLREIDSDFEKAQAGSATQLVTPFDYLSCEQIGESHSILRTLYSDLFLGLSDIESRNNLVLTGPRGCGKSTVFRSLSLRHRLAIGELDPTTISYVGIYYRCDDLYFAFPRFRRPMRAEALDLPIHFVTSALLIEVLTATESWARRSFSEEMNREEQRVSRKVWQALGVDPPAEPGADTFKAVIARLHEERRRAAEKHRFANGSKQELGTYFGADTLVRACEAISVSFSFLQGRPFYFFIDDYSSPKITKELQESLNRIFMQRTAACFFKLSTESPVSFSRADIDGKTYVEGREFTLLNLGIVYLHAAVSEKSLFVDDVFRRRLSALPSFPASNLATLVGNNPDFNNNEEARRIRNDQRSELWGAEMLSRLCSGDLHYLIGLVRDMVIQAGGETTLRELKQNNMPPTVPASVQNSVIRATAGSFLRSLRGIPKHGDRLVEIVTAFGNVAHSYLKFRDSTNEKGKPPHQASRIEPYESCALSSEAQKIYDELLRYSVFIEDVRGKSRRGKVVTRLYLRRFLIPHFNLTFSTRDSVEIEPSEFELFLLQPTRFEEKFRLRGRQSSGGAPLFGASDGTE